MEGSLMSFVQAAKARVAGRGADGLEVDSLLVAGRPALREFICSTVDGAGGVRERSVLMICVEDDGLRVGLKDQSLGGWCWRMASTFEDGLTALDQALRDGTARFGGWKGGKGRKGG
jgi:hypothetical protein